VLKPKYIYTFVLAIILFSCNDTNFTSDSESKTLHIEEKYLVTNGNSVLVSKKEFNKSGLLVFSYEYRENGNLLKSINYSYSENRRKERVTTFDNNGQIDKIELSNSTYGIDGKLLKIEKTDTSGNLFSTVELGYDSKGNIEYLKEQENENLIETHFEYNFLNGNLSERLTKVIGQEDYIREKLTYLDKLKVIKESYNGKGLQTSKIIYTYRNDGYIISEEYYTSDNSFLKKYTFSYKFW
jgi:hypothetical protein